MKTFQKDKETGKEKELEHVRIFLFLYRFITVIVVVSVVFMIVVTVAVIVILSKFVHSKLFIILKQQIQMEKGAVKNTQKAIEEKIGINFATFSKSCVLGQNILTNFISGGKDQRRAIIEETLGMCERKPEIKRER